MFGLPSANLAAFRSARPRKRVSSDRRREVLCRLLGEQLEERRVLTGYVVDTVDDVVAEDGMISLREAIQAANTNTVVNADVDAGEAGPGVTDTISFAAGLSAITLTSQLSVTDSLAISLGDVATITISGGDATRLFSVDEGASPTEPTVLSIDGLTLSNGVAESGGAFFVSSGQALTLNNVTLSDNRATSTDAGQGGGAIFSDGGTVDIAGSTISDNFAASEGGGLWNGTGIMTISDSTTITGNAAAGSGADSGGGGIFNDGGTLDITDATIDNNLAAGGTTFSLDGGQENPPVTTDATGEATLQFNPVDDTFSLDLFVTGIELTDTTTSPELTGAHVHLGDVGANGGVIIPLGTGMWVEEAGGIRLRRAGVPVPAENRDAFLSGGTYINLHSSDNGGGEIRGQVVFPATMGSGGGIFNDAGTVTVTGGEISANVASRAGGGIEANAGTTTVSGATISDNIVGPAGVATPGNGGGVHISGAGTVSISSSRVQGNTAGNEGGGLWNSGAGTLSVRDSLVDSNTAPQGGGIFQTTGTGVLNVIGSTLFGNTADDATNAIGGGIALGGGTATLRSATIANNTAAAGGGGISVQAGTLDSFNSVLSGNTGVSATTGADVDGAFGTSANTFLGSADGATGITATDGNTLGGNPLLQVALTDNGGPTLSLLPLESSPLIDTGDAANLDSQPFDQRGIGFTRVSGAGLDIGAVETQVVDSDLLTVTTFTDVINAGDGLLSLREAVIQANAVTGTNTIQLGAGIYTLTLSGDDEDAAATGDLDISDELVITGAGEATTTIDASGLSDRVFEVLSSIIVSMSGVTIMGGSVAGDGGGILNAGALTLDSVVIDGNTASGNGTDIAGSGGGIFNASTATLEVTDSTISSNVANRAGGGIEDASNVADTVGVTLTNVILTSNNAGVAPATAAPGNGGGLHVTGAGDILIDGGSVTSNVAALEGGGLWNGSGLMTITGTTISGNTASGAAADEGGGGIFNNGGTLSVTDATITMNVADGASGSGGGVLNLGGTATFSNTEISANTANRAGGGIEATADSTTTLTGVNLDDNVAGPDGSAAPGNGGGMHITGNGDATISGGTVSGNTAASEGGGLWNGSGTMSVTDTMLVGNTVLGTEADNGGGALFNNGGTLQLSGVTVADNVADGPRGGGSGVMNVAMGTVTIDASTFTDNTAAGTEVGDGGGAVLNIDGSVTITNSTLTGNSATGTSGSGGAILSRAGTLSVTDTTISGNTANRAGGGIEIGRATVTLTGVTLGGEAATDGNSVSGTEANPGNGGGLHTTFESVVTITGGSIQNNTAVEGGGLWNSALSTMNVSNVRIEDNSAVRGGGVYQQQPGDTVPLEVTFTNLSPDSGATDSGLFLTPIFNAFHDGTFDLFDIDTTATAGLESLAEDGDTSGALADFATAQASGVSAALANGGPIAPGEIVSSVFVLNPTANRYHSFASMVIPSNDAFIGNDDPLAMELFDEDGNFVGPIDLVVFGADVLDAGTELNTEADAAFFDQTMANTGTSETEAIAAHLGFLGSSALPGITPVILGGTQSVGPMRTFGTTNADFSIADYELLQIQITQVASGLTLDSVTIQNNTATGDESTDGGGGIYNEGAVVTINGGSVIGNVASGASGSGGGIFNSGSLIADMTAITDNTANRAGGGIEATAGSSTTLTDVSLDNNIAGPDGSAAPGNGGGLHITGAGDASITNGTVNGNAAANEGGGLWNGSGLMTVSAATVSGNSAAGDLADDGGGGIFNNGGTLEVSDATITMNVADGSSGSGGGVLNLGGSVTLTDTSITDNTANRAGGGIEATAGSMTTLTGVNLDNNVAGPDGSASPGNGGGLHITGDGSASLTDGTVSGNSAALEGGGLWNGSGSMTISGTAISGNTATGDAADDGGGGIFNNGGTLTITGATISDNIADGTAGSGGGILNLGGVLDITDTTISGNTANRAGGGIETTAGSTVTLTNVILGNDGDDENDDTEGNSVAEDSAPGNGGGLHVSGDGVVAISDGRIAGNSAIEGAGLWNSAAGSISVDGTTITDNTAVRGGGIYNDETVADADAVFALAFSPLNGSTATGSGTVSVSSPTETTREVRVVIDMEGLEDLSTIDGAVHVAHIHGQFAGNASRPILEQGDGLFFDGAGGGANGVPPIDSVPPSIADDDGRTIEDGFLDFLEGRPKYGPVLLNLTSTQLRDVATGSSTPPDGVPPLTHFLNLAGAGTINPAELFPSGTEFNLDTTYTFDLSDPDDARQFNNLVPLELREIVIHGQTVATSISDPINEAAGDGAPAGTPLDGDPDTSFRITAPVAVAEITAVSGSVTITGATITANIATGAEATDGGGGIFNSGSLTVVNSDITANVANGAAGSGGGIWNAGTATASESEISGNSANRAGGGIESVAGSSTNLNNVNLDANIAGPSGFAAPGNGGGIHITGDGTASIVGGTVSGNTAASEGGGLWNGTGVMSIDGTNITDNTASGSAAAQGGGGIFSVGGSVLVSDATITGNAADGTSGSGGGVLNMGTLTVTGSTSISTNTANRAGGGIEATAGSTTTLNDVTLADNVAGPDGTAAPGNGGAFHISGNGNATITGGSVTGNVAASEGGGFWNGSGTMTVSGTSFSDNTANGTDSDNGGGALFNNGGALNITDATITENLAGGVRGGGGGVMNDAGGIVSIDSTTISDNIALGAMAGDGGGAVLSTSGTVNITDSTFAGNTATGVSGSGGAILVRSGSLSVTDSTISANLASRAGGGIETVSATVVLDNVILGGDEVADGNSVGGSGANPGNGGALHVSSNANVTITGGSIRNNAAVEGGGLWNSATAATSVNDVVIEDNSAVRGGGVYQQGGATAVPVQITITNLSPDSGPNDSGLYLTPIFNAFHAGGYDLFSVGSAASAGLESLAEDGATSTIQSEFAAAQTTGVFAVLPGLNGVIAPTETVTSVVFLNPTDNRYHSYASMVIPSNDAFIGNDDPTMFALFDEDGNFAGPFDFIVPGAAVLDAGTEVNSETDAAFFDQTAPNSGTDQNGTVATHPGFIGSVGNPDGTSIILGGSQSVATMRTFGVDNADFTADNFELLQIQITQVNVGLTLDGVTLQNNTATGAESTDGGGGLYNDGGEVTVNGGSITGNVADGDSGSGGGVFNAGTFTADNTSITNNTANRAGGGIEATAASTTTLNAVNLDDNVAGPTDTAAPGNGGGLHITGNGNASITDGTVAGNTAALEGGGLWNGSGELTVTGTTISGNVASGDAADDGGGGIFNNGGTVTVSGATISTNIADGTSGSGGGILNLGTLSVTDSTITGNTANRAGGGIEVTADSTTTLTGIQLTDNVAGPEGTANPGNGGGVHTSGNGVVGVTASTVSGNSAANEGGGLWNSGSGTLTIDASTITANTSGDGGGVFNDGEGGDITITNSTIGGNTATTSGGGIASEGAAVTLTSVTIVRNTAETGGGLSIADGTTTTTNSIIALNTATTGTDISGSVTSSGNNLIGDSTDATLVGSDSSDILDVDPLLDMLADNGGPTQTIALLEGSPAISAGVAAGLDIDQRGTPRPQGPRIDIGAFESALVSENDVVTLALAATDADKAEGDDGTTVFTFTVTRLVSTAGITTVDYAVTGGDTNPATADDFDGGEFPSGMLTFDDGEETQAIMIAVAADTDFESDESFVVTLSGATAGVEISPATASGVIRNDDEEVVINPTLSIATTDADKNEGDSGTTEFTFTVTRGGDTTVATDVNYAVTGGDTDPASADDFDGGALPSGTVEFAADEVTKTITIGVVGDTVVENDESFVVTLSGATANAEITTAIADGTIRNDDAVDVPSFAISTGTSDQDEGDTGTTPFTFTVTRSGVVTGDYALNYLVTGGDTDTASSSDFDGGAFPSGTVMFTGSETTQTITINVVGDTDVEADEAFVVTLSDPTSVAQITNPSAGGTIRNDDVVSSVPTLSIAAAAADQNEGDAGSTEFTFTVTRGSITTGETTVDFTVTGGTSDPATAADFTENALPSGTVTFADDEDTQTITINVAGDMDVESDESFVVTLSNASGDAMITGATADGTIRNDDVAAGTPTLAIAATDADKNEGNAGTTDFTFTVTRSSVTSGELTVDYVVTAGATNPVLANDFAGGVFAAGTVTFADGDMTMPIVVSVSGDTQFESDESFVVTLSNASVPAQITTASAAGTIRNDDADDPGVAGLSIIAAAADRFEGDSGARAFTFTVARSGNTTGIATATYTVMGFGANPAGATDFFGTFPSGTVSFADGDTEVTLTIDVSGDVDVESDEGFTVTLSNPSDGAEIVLASANGMIRDDDQPATGSRILVPDVVARTFSIPGDSKPTAIIFQALESTTLTVTPIGIASATEIIRVLDGNLNAINEFIVGITTAELDAGGLYAIIFESQTSERLYSVRSSEGLNSLSTAPRTNILRPTDTNASGETTARDALLVIDALASSQAQGESAAASQTFLDVSRDGRVSALDALLIINQLDRESRAFGESLVNAEQAAPSSTPATSLETSDVVTNPSNVDTLFEESAEDLFIASTPQDIADFSPDNSMSVAEVDEALGEIDLFSERVESRLS